MPHILLVDDDPAQREPLLAALEAEGLKATAVGSREATGGDFDFFRFDLIVADPESISGTEENVLQHAQPVPVVVLTGQASVRSAVNCMKLGAADYLVKPCAIPEIVGTIKAVLADYDRNPVPGQGVAGSPGHFFEGSCPRLRRLTDHVHKVALTDSTVLIQGETGTGKELTARRVHQLSLRSDERMIAVNCAAIPDTLIESELFGYEKGAFTGANTNRVGLIEAASGGTLFLDEIGELPLAAQARLLRFIQEGEIRRIGSVNSRRVDVRLICATHRDLADLARRNEFRQDLFYRINVLRLEIPPLRDRGADIRGMAEWFAEAVAARLGRPHRLLSDAALEAVCRYQWPGNVRELEHAIERGVVMAEGREIATEDLGLPGVPVALAPRGPVVSSLPEDPSVGPAMDEELSLEDYFQRFVLEHQDSMSETELAQKLGISRKCLWERRQRFDLPRKKASRRKRA